MGFTTSNSYNPYTKKKYTPKTKRESQKSETALETALNPTPAKQKHINRLSSVENYIFPIF